MLGVKFLIISRLGAAGVQKGRFGRPKIQLYSKVTLVVTGTRDVERKVNPFMPTVAFNNCCPRDCVSRTANVGTVGKNELMKNSIGRACIWESKSYPCTISIHQAIQTRCKVILRSALEAALHEEKRVSCSMERKLIAFTIIRTLCQKMQSGSM